MRIKVLPDALVNQIAAGEVVERPVSIVRELVDNAVDAGATDISVTIDNGGQSLIRVVDDGCGMERNDAILAFERHATSKVSSKSDLLAIATLGFRGEALAAISAVSKVRLRTATPDSQTGTEVTMDGGVLRGAENVAAAPGTEVEVRHLFYNTPARRKFLRSPRSDEARIRRWLLHNAVARPTIRFRLVTDGREALNLAPAADAAARARMIVRGTAVAFDLGRDGCRVRGLVGHPSLAQADTDSFVVVVNHRVVSDRLVVRAVKEGFGMALKDREFPVGCVIIDLDPGDVDVNVHPQKSEVRFRNLGLVLGIVRDAVAEALRDLRGPLATPPARQAIVAHPPAWLTHGGAAVAESPASSLSPVPRAMTAPLAAPRAVDDVPDLAEFREAAPTFRFADLVYRTQVLGCFLVCEADERLYVIDMHAAHERCTFNRLRRQFAERSVKVQQLLLPVTVPLSPDAVVRLEDYRDVLTGYGFDFEAFGADAVLVRAAPALVKLEAIAAIFKEAGAREEGGGAAASLDERIERVAARLACHASVRSGDLLGRAEAEALLRELDEAELSGACPHGRPVIVEFDRETVERWFGRDR